MLGGGGGYWRRRSNGGSGGHSGPQGHQHITRRRRSRVLAWARRVWQAERNDRIRVIELILLGKDKSVRRSPMSQDRSVPTHACRGPPRWHLVGHVNQALGFQSDAQATEPLPGFVPHQAKKLLFPGARAVRRRRSIDPKLLEDEFETLVRSGTTAPPRHGFLAPEIVQPAQVLQAEAGEPVRAAARVAEPPIPRAKARVARVDRVEQNQIWQAAAAADDEDIPRGFLPVLKHLLGALRQSPVHGFAELFADDRENGQVVGDHRSRLRR